MSAQTAKITPGKWVVHKPISGGIFVVTEMPVVSVCFYYADAAEANAALIAEAGTVANETGLTPRQLADQRAELLEAARNMEVVLRRIQGTLARYSPDGDLQDSLEAVNALIDIAEHKDVIAKQITAGRAIQRATGEQP